MQAILKVVRTVDAVLGVIVAIIVFTMMALIVADATGRALNAPIPGVVELTEEYLMIAVVFLSLGLAHSAGQHIRIEIFGHMWPVIRHRFVRMAIDLAGAVYFALIAWQGGSQVAYAWSIGQRSASELAYPLAPAYAIVVFGSLIMCLWLIFDVILLAAGRAPETRESSGTS